MADSRPLTNGELAAARAIFGSAIRYQEVRIHRGKYIFFQPSDTAMTPNGEIYFPEPVYKPDYSTNVADTSWLIHELTHVWQYQTGVNVRLRAPFSRNYDYGKLTPATRFSDLNIEQQAASVADYYLLEHGTGTQHGTGTLRDYQALIPFLPITRPVPAR